MHDTETNAATAFVALNNPHAAQISAAEQLCPDVCPQVRLDPIKESEEND